MRYPGQASWDSTFKSEAALRAENRPLILLGHCPEQLYAAIIAPGEGDVVVLGYLFKQLSPIIFRFILQTKEQGGSGFLRSRRVDDLLYPNAHALIGVW